MTILYFILGLGLLIFIHELGHFLVAKWAGIRVEKFSLGFGPKLIGFTRGETEYRVSILPLGGYVKMSGEDPEEGEIKPLDDPRSFAAQPLRKRVLVVAAGPIMNLLLALVLMPIVFMVGRMEPVFLYQPPVVLGVKAKSPAQEIGLEKGDKILSIEQTATPTWDEALQRILMNPNREVTLKVQKKSGTEETKKVKLSQVKEGKAGFLGVEPSLFLGNEAEVDKVAPDSPAEKAGIRSKDRILKIGGEIVADWQDMSDKISQSNGKPVVVEVLRGSEKLELNLTPQYSDANKKWILGITKEFHPEDFVKHRYGFVESIKRGMKENVRLFGLTLEVLKKLFTFQLSYKALGGPVQIAQATAQAAHSGLGDFIFFLSFLSMQLGILNLLPIPVLDGGHLFFMGYEVIRRKPLSIKKRIIAQQVGMLVLFTLMILVTVNDIDTIWGIKKLLGKIVSWF
ncbi:MAG: RIP metalloprotease RseP [bacterium]